MKLDYRALWFEDDLDWAKAAQETIEEWLAEQGFRFIPILVQEELIDYRQLQQYGPEDELDLILVDLNLEGQKGDEVIQIVRTGYKYTDIVFYSAIGASNVRELASEAKIDGVYCAGRPDLAEEAIGVIGTTIKKVLDINHMRGVVMAATAQLDNTLDQCIESFVRNSPSPDQEIVDGIARKLLRDVRKNVKKAESDLVSGQGLSAVLESSWFSSDKRVSRLRALTKQSSDLQGENESLEKYRENVLADRNVLAHAVEERRKDGTKVLKGWGGKADREFDAEHLRQLRREIIRREEDMLEMLRKLTAGS